MLECAIRAGFKFSLKTIHPKHLPLNRPTLSGIKDDNLSKNNTVKFLIFFLTMIIDNNELARD